MKLCILAFLFVVVFVSTIPDNVDAKLDCWGPCHDHGGPCPGACGKNGYCCRKGHYDYGCGTGQGCKGYHCCVTITKFEQDPTQ